MFDRRDLIRAALCAPMLGAGPARAAQSSGNDDDIAQFIAEMPKAEYHVHLEGTLEPQMKFALARRNGVTLPFADVAAMKRSYVFHDLPSFLAVYYDGFKVLVGEPDFYDLTFAYLRKAASQNILYAEMFFDPQEHLKRGVRMEAMIGGITRARVDAAARLGIQSQLILCFVRDMPTDTAMAALDAALPMKRYLVGVGLDSDEKGHPPIQFADHFAKARAAGLKVTMHCDLNQDDTLRHIRQAIVDLAADRIDHGGNIVESPELMALARRRNLCFTVCPGFSGAVRGGGRTIDVVRAMLDKDLMVTINSDDPAYMGGEYLNEVLIKAQAHSLLTRAELVRIERNAFRSAWLPEPRRNLLLAKLEIFALRRGVLA
ncbi:adenosine deaminase [uncultured Sphingomonas sp.]|uniref:adenosine deaminase n=1 Tax=uncultured Sphingomonas sp. TaxID=158754 RepID=UPI0035CBD96D